MNQLRINFDQPQVPGHDNAVRHVIARIAAPATAKARELPPLHLAIVIDASGSMSGAPLAAVKRATLQIARELPACTRLTIVSFASDVCVHADGVLLDPMGREEVHQLIAQLETRGCTDLHAGWRTGCTLLNSYDDAPSARRRHVVVLSDGHANQGVVEPAELAPESRTYLDRGISTSCVGVGDGYSPDQLAALAEHGGGVCHDAENAQEIVEVLMGEVLSLAEVVAEHIKLVLEVPEGVTASELSGMPGTFDGRLLVVSAGSVRAGVDRAIAVRLEIPAGVADPDGDLTVVGHLTWRDPGSPERNVGPRVRANACRSHDIALPPTLEDARTVLLAWQAHLVSVVTSRNRDGDFAGLKRFWDEQLEPFTAYANLQPQTRDFARTVARMRQRAEQPMPERQRKQALDLAVKSARQADVYYCMDKGGVEEQFLPDDSTDL